MGVIIVTDLDLDFLVEAKAAFLDDESLSTYRDKNDKWIALRLSADQGFRDSIQIYKIQSQVGIFSGVLPEGRPLVLGKGDK